MSKLNCCGQALKALLILVNVFILVVGVFTVAVGSVTVAAKLDLDYATGSDAFNGAAVAIAAGIVLILAGVIGMVAGCAELWGLVAFYNFCLCGLIALGLGTTGYSISNEDDISQRAQDQFSTDLGIYALPSDIDYNRRANNYVDIIQTAYQCCGFTGPGDWLVENPEYCVDNLGLPESCHCDSDFYDDCFSVTIPIPFADDLTFSSWTKGCQDSIIDMVSAQTMIAAIIAFAMVVCEVMVMCCGCGLCCLLMTHRRREMRRTVHYTPVEPYHDEIVMDTGTLKKLQQPAYQPEEPAYPPPAYYSSSHPNNGDCQTYQPV